MLICVMLRLIDSQFSMIRNSPILRSIAYRLESAAASWVGVVMSRVYGSCNSGARIECARKGERPSAAGSLVSSARVNLLAERA